MTDEEIERIAKGYAGPDFRKRRRVRVEPLLEYSSGEWALDEFLALLQDIKATMPPDAKDARVECDGGGHDETGKISVSYVTWESEEEVADRVKRALDYARSVETHERLAYERLKAKYG